MKKIKKIINILLLLDIIKGLLTTLKYLFKKKITIYYPDQEIPKSPRFRGLLALRKYNNGEERCIACKLCESSCPAMAIEIDSSYDPKSGKKMAKKYDIDMFKCIGCGFCEEACPTDAIVMTNLSHYIFRKRGENIFTKDKLLFIGDHYEKSININKEKDAKYK